MHIKYKYFVQTHNELPQSKHVWDNIWRLPFLINKMIERKPANYPYPNLETSIRVVKIDPNQVYNWNDIFTEMLLWNWDTVKPPVKKKEESLCEKTN